MNPMKKSIQALISIISVSIYSMVMVLPVTSPAFAAGSATLALSPSSSTVASGSTFDVQIILNTGSSNTSGTDVSLKFDKDKLNIVDIKNGTIYDQYVGKNINNASGVATISGLASSTSSLYKGTGTFATITFRAISGGTAAVTFNYTPGNKNDTNVADFDTQDEALSSVTNGSYTITGSSTTTTTGTTNTTTTTTTTTKGGLPVTASSLPFILLIITSILLVGSGIYFYKFYKKAQ